MLQLKQKWKEGSSFVESHLFEFKFMFAIPKCFDIYRIHECVSL